MNNSDVSWEKWGAADPYFGVITHDRFKRECLTEESKAEFFQSGELHIQSTLALVTKIFGPVTYGRALDFGCGVGRLVIPLAQRFNQVTGVDISEGMLAETRANCQARSIENAKFIKSDDALSMVSGRFDFVHTFIVLQHIPVSRGEPMFLRMVDMLQPGGAGALHVSFHGSVSLLRRMTMAIRKHFTPFHWLLNVLRGRSFSTPLMQMNSYNLSSLLIKLGARGIKEVHVELSDQGSGIVGAFLIFRKPLHAEV